MLKQPLGPLMVDVAGTTLTPIERTFLCSPAVGAVILFSRNYENQSQVKSLIAEIKALRFPELLIAVDQEGGRVQRFKNEFTILPPMDRFEEMYRSEPERTLFLCETTGKLMAAELAGVGVDFSFAPVLDTKDSRSNVIGDRSFSADANIICTLAGAFINGMHSAGMAATGKHFPGHGGVVGDSHVMKPIDTRDVNQLYNSDLIPFQVLTNQLGGIMTAHVHFPNIDSALPTFSRFWLKEILRQKIGFQGVIFSDDLTMKGAHEIASPLERTETALSAGCDMALICNDPESAYEVANTLDLRTIDPAYQHRLEAMRLKVKPLPVDSQMVEMRAAVRQIV